MITHTLPKPARNIIGHAWDGSVLWAGDWETPGRLVRMTFVDGTLVAVVSDPETDDRSIHRFSPGSGSCASRRGAGAF